MEIQLEFNFVEEIDIELDQERKEALIKWMESLPSGDRINSGTD